MRTNMNVGNEHIAAQPVEFVCLYCLNLRGVVETRKCASSRREIYKKSNTVEGTKQLEGYRERIIQNGWYLNPNLKLQELARRLGIPAKELSALINRENLTNFKVFINELRIEHSKGLLRDTNLNILDIVDASGFNSLSVFYEQFNKFQGEAPGKYRNCLNSLINTS